MKKSMRLSIPGILLILLGGFLPSAAHAGPSAQSGTARLAQIKSNPCNGGNEGSAGGGRTAFLCNGWRGVQGMIDVPVRTWTTSPAYPLAGVPFKIGIGVDQDSLNTQFPSSDITFPGEIRFFDYRTEIRLVPVKLGSGYFGWNFNGILDYDDSIFYTPSASARDWYGVDLAVPSFYEDPLMYSASHNPDNANYYPVLSGLVDGFFARDDTVIFSAYSSMSSYHADNPTTFKGEPAFRLEVTSYYLVQARARWDSYQKWERKKVGEKTECRPGPSSSGNIECMAIVGGWWQPGHYVTVDIYDYQWGASVPWNEVSDGLNWVTVDSIDTNKVAWPDGSIHDHIPILIYQAQPILQKP
jgi:hypothetical protein